MIIHEFGLDDDNSALVADRFADDALAILAKEVYGYREPWSDQALGEIATQLGENAFLVAEMDCAVAGVLSYRVNSYGTVAHVDALATRHDLQRGRGVGSTLMAELEETLVDRGVDLITLQAKDASGSEDFYIKQGFSWIGVGNIYEKPL